MNKQDMTDEIVRLSQGDGKKEVSQLQVRYVLSMFGYLAYEALKDRQQVTCFGLGKFVVVKSLARKGRNPRTGAVITIPKKHAIKFVVNRQFKNGV
jgi:DNA-binding protein HU-beta